MCVCVREGREGEKKNPRVLSNTSLTQTMCDTLIVIGYLLNFADSPPAVAPRSLLFFLPFGIFFLLSLDKWPLLARLFHEFEVIKQRIATLYNRQPHCTRTCKTAPRAMHDH